MANVKFPRKEFEKQLGRKITPEIEEKINLLGTPLESLNKNEIEIEVFPNRPDFLSMQGYIRALKAFLGKDTGLIQYKVNPPLINYTVKIEQSVKSVRPHTVCAIIKKIKLDNLKIKEIVNIQEKIHTTLGRNRKKLAIGVYPLEKLKLPIKYEARKPHEIKFTPLEAKRVMNASQILKHHPKGRDYAHLLESHKKYPVFVDSDNKILSMPPIINSHETGKIDENTNELFIECSGFDLNLLNKTLNILVTSLSDMGGTIYSVNILDDNKKIISPDLTPDKISLSNENTNKLLGLDIKTKEIDKLLSRMGYEYSASSKIVSIPAWRTDILHEVDIIEDIAISYGYNKFTPIIPKVSTDGQESLASKLKNKISEILSGLSLLEISNYHLIKPEEAKKMKLKNLIELENSKTDYKLLRPNLLIPTLRVLSENKDNEYPQNVYEIGTVFSTNSKNETDIHEQTNLIISLTPSNFTEAKQHLDAFFRSLSLKYTLKESEHLQLIEGRTGSILLNKKDIGYIGELNPQTLHTWGIKMPLAIIELNLDEILKEL